MKNFKVILLALVIAAAGCTDKPVDPPALSVTGVEVEFSTLTLKPGEKHTLRALVAPANAADLTISWTSDNEEVATVDGATGEVTAIAEGTAMITVTTKNGGKTDVCTVTVSALPVPGYDFIREGTEQGADDTVVISWGLTADGLLVVSGNGAMRDYVVTGTDDATARTDAPWFDLGVTSVIVGDGVTAVGEFAFAALQTMTEATIGEGVETIGRGAFARSYAVTEVTTSDDIETIGNSAFYSCISLESATFGEGLRSIGQYAFYGCALLKSISLPDATHTIGLWAFSSCLALESVSLGSGMQYIMDFAFHNCPLLDGVVIPEGVLAICASSFAFCTSLSSIVIPDSATYVGESAFDKCDVLESVVIGSGIQLVERWAFRRCEALTDVTIRATTPPILLNVSYADESSFSVDNDVLRVPTGCKAAYEEDEVWSSLFATIIESE